MRHPRTMIERKAAWAVLEQTAEEWGLTVYPADNPYRGRFWTVGPAVAGSTRDLTEVLSEANAVLAEQGLKLSYPDHTDDLGTGAVWCWTSLHTGT